MDKKYIKSYSKFLNREMEYSVYGDKGKPVIVFPTGGKRFFQFEDSGMLEVCSELIDMGKIQMFAVDGLDWEHFEGSNKLKAERIQNYVAYYNYVMNEFILEVKNINKTSNKLLSAGCSFGAFHALNVMLRNPNIFDSAIAMSGIYNTARYFHGFMNNDLHLNSPLVYMEELIDEKNINAYFKSKIIISCGQGKWEEDALGDTVLLKDIFDKKRLPGFFDIWGFDVSHEFAWWRKQFPYFLRKVVS